MDIHFHHIVKQYSERTALDVEQLVIHSGELLGVVGNNGAGKTTLFRLMLDLTQATKGQVTYVSHDGGTHVNPAQSEDWKGWTGAFIDQGFLIDFLTPEEYFALVMQSHHLAPIDWQHAAEQEGLLPQIRQLVDEELLGGNRLIRELSMGNKQKVGIVAALLPQPKVVVLDEPFNFLDPKGQIAMKHLLHAYHECTNSTILVSSHNLHHVVDISTRVLLLEDGRVKGLWDNDNRQAQQVLEDYFGS